MVWDPEEERFVLRQFNGGQTSMFDEDDYETVEEEWGVFRDMPDDAHSLPAPAAEEEDGEAAGTPSPFEWLSQFIGETLIVTEAMGNYTVRTEDNRLVLSSATGEENPFWCSADKLAPHVGHQVVCVGYGDDEIVNVSIECEDCNTVLFDIDAPEATDEEVSAATAVPDEPAPDLSDGEEDDLDYEEPEE